MAVEKSGCLATARVEGDKSGNTFLLVNSPLRRPNYWRASYTRASQDLPGPESAQNPEVQKTRDRLANTLYFAFMARAF